ncbi:MAG TPA: isoprenylcysteine carboxylmethyltransferase family protein [Ktedonobacterales bacterium]|nr:isoprenylcysteine carboxylmethyltransferase family protein [Ktedonobacterales bacterium]
MDDMFAQGTTRPQRADSPGIRIPPPLVVIAVFLLGWLMQSRFPLPFLPNPAALILGAVLILAYLVLALAAIPTMIRGGGTLNTSTPSKALVTTGIYQITRNPLYLSLLLLYLGVACLTSMTWAAILLPFLLVYSQILIVREERYLTRAFGAAYTDYKAHVRRWL